MKSVVISRLCTLLICASTALSSSGRTSAETPLIVHPTTITVTTSEILIGDCNIVDVVCTVDGEPCTEGTLGAWSDDVLLAVEVYDKWKLDPDNLLIPPLKEALMVILKQKVAEEERRTEALESVPKAVERTTTWMLDSRVPFPKIEQSSRYRCEQPIAVFPGNSAESVRDLHTRPITSWHCTMRS